MNYIRLINAFYDRLELNQLSTSAIALWHALVHINNKAGWLEEFTVAVSVLCVKTGLSERTVTNARNELKTKGYIFFKSRKGNKSAIYSLIDLSESIACNFSYEIDLTAINADSVSESLSDSVSESLSDNPSALIKQNKTKLNKTNLEVVEAPSQPRNVFDFFKQNGFGTIGSHISEKIIQWCNDLSDDLVLFAMQLAVEKGATHFSYVESILRNWANKNIRTVKDAEALIAQYKQSKVRSTKQNSKKPIRTEVLPDWFDKEYNEDNKNEQESLAKKKEIESLLKKLSNKDTVNV